MLPPPSERVEALAGGVCLGVGMFIAVDLKVVEGLAEATARCAGVDSDRILAGLVRLWHRVWVDEADILSKSEIGGVFGAESIGKIIAALVTFGFLERALKGSYRVKGAKRYIRLKESRRRGAQKTNALKRRSRALGSDAQAPLSHALSVLGAGGDSDFAQGKEEAF